MKYLTRYIPSALCVLAAAAAAAQEPRPAVVTEDPIADTAMATDAAAVDSAAGKAVVLSRSECLRIALQESPVIKIADMEITRLDLARKETRASLLPQIDFTGAYQRALALQTVSMNMGGETQSFKMGTDNTWNFGFSASVPLIAPTLWKSLQLSETQILASCEKARASRLDLADQVNQAYYTLMLAKASYDVVRENYELAKYTAGLYEKQFSMGTATEYDVLRSSVQVKNVEPELIQAQIAIDRARLQLKVLMGITDDIVIDPDMTLTDMRQEMYGRIAGIDRSLQGNSDLRSLDIQTRMLEQTASLKKLAWVPTLAAQFSYSWSALSNGNALRSQQFNPYSNLGLSLSVPLFSGGSKYYGLKQAEVQVKEARLQRDNLVNTLNMQIDLALENIRKEAKQIDTSAEGVRQAEKAHEIMKRSFEIGAGSYLSLRDSEVAETAAKLAYLQAIYNYLISASQLDLLLGREDELQNAGYTYPATTE